MPAGDRRRFIYTYRFDGPKKQQDKMEVDDSSSEPDDSHDETYVPDQ